MSTVAVVGATGYTGMELVRLLARHPHVKTLRIYGSDRSAGQEWATVAPRLRHLHDGMVESFEATAVEGMDAVFLALPHGHSGETAKALHGSVGCVIDLSGDLRLSDATLYDRWYGRKAAAPDLLGEAVYGLPEIDRKELPGATLISNPGCYATAVTLAIVPALAAEGLCGEDIVVTAVSGASGAGKKADANLLSAELHGNLRAYRIGAHQHVPEVLQTIERATDGRRPKLTFVPQVAAFDRGILAIATLPLKPGQTRDDVVRAYVARYADCPFVRLALQRPPEIADVVGTNFCDIYLDVDTTGHRIVAIAAIDNLVKGAAGQAIQNWNIARGDAETVGLM
ncbi:MAG: N-acetyl-gamma-glutamyl-phosphate reductase [Planctomycetota bacterium]